MRVPRALSGLLLCLATSCSDGESQMAGPLTATGFAEAWSQRWCAALFRCPVVGEAGSAVALLQDPARCAAQWVDPMVADLARHVAEGSVRFDPTAAQACLARVSTGCAALGDGPSALCPTVFTGTVAADGACWRSEQCAAGLYCDHGSDVTRACPGACRAQFDEGLPCDGDRACRGWSSGGVVCHLGGCAAITQRATPAVEGEACGVVDGDPLTRARCAEGLVCLADVCRRPVAVGARCGSGEACAAGAVCAPDPSAIAHANTCQRASTRVRSAAGGACSRDDSGSAPTCNPVAHLACGDAGACVSVGDGSLGSACAPGGGVLARSCAPTLRCDDATSRCVARVAAGGACRRDDDCAAGACLVGRCAGRYCL